MSWLFKGIKHSELYLRFRPTYPDEVYEVIVSELAGESSSSHWKRAIDIGCGTGQSTLPLSEYFDEVIGIDPSETQIQLASQSASDRHKNNVTFVVGVAHDLPSILDDSVDLITAAQAAHWFNLERFYAESMRILRPGGIVALYGHGPVTILEAEGHSIFKKFFNETMEGYWEIGREHSDTLYCDIYTTLSKAYPDSKRNDSIGIHRTYHVEEFIGYLKTLSAYQQYIQKNPHKPDPIEVVRAQLLSVYTKDGREELIHVSRPVFILLAKKSRSC